MSPYLITGPGAFGTENEWPLVLAPLTAHGVGLPQY